MKRKYIYLLFPFFVFHLFLLTHLKFTDWPEMISFPYLFNHGYKLYSDMVHIYPPFLTALLALFYKVFGTGVMQLKIFTWSLALLSDYVFFLIAKKIFNKKVAYFLLFVYIILSSFLDGNMLWFDTALTLPLLSAFYFFLKDDKKGVGNNLIISGALISIACLIKQSAVVYLIAFSLLVFVKHKFSGLKRFLLVPFIAGISFLGYLTFTNQLSWFYNWAFYYPLHFWSKYPSYVDFALPLHETGILTILGVAISPLIFVFRKIKNKAFLPCLLIFVTSLVATYPRLSFFHLQPTIAFFVMLVGFVAFNMGKLKGSYMLLFYLVILVCVRIMWRINAGGSDRFTSSLDAELTSALATENGPVLMLGPFSSYYVFSNTLPPKPWLDNFGWYWEMPGVQGVVLDEYKKQDIKTVVVRTPISGNWYDLGVYLPQDVYSWVKSDFTKTQEINGIEIWKKD